MKRLLNTVLLTLISVSGFSQTTVTFTSSSSFTVPAGVTSVAIEVVGAGGSGGGNGGGGGGGGGYASGTYSVTPGAVLAVTVGTAGAGPAGGTSSVDMLISATGGANGTSVANPSVGGGGAGGVGTGGTINRTGGNGGGGYWTYFGGGGGGAAGSVSNGSAGGNTITWTGVCQTPGGSAGLSGGAPGGNGGKGAGFTDAGCNITDPSGNGLNYGGGGGGGNGNGGIAGTGMPGYVTITYNGCSINTATSLTGTTISAAQAGVSYQWINCAGNTLINGETNQDFTPAQTGNYAVILDNGSCADTSVCINVIICNLAATTNLAGTTLTANQLGTYQWINCQGNTPVPGETNQSFIPAQTGNYAVIINDGNCIDTSSCVNVVVCTLDATTVTSGDTVQAVQTGTYQWINCAGNTIIPGATGQVFAPQANGSYAVIITDAGCTDTSGCVTIAGLGVENNALAKLSIYPNPFQTHIQVLNATGNETYELMNSLGQVIWSGVDISGRNFLSLAKGVYVLRIMKGADVRQVKLIKD